MQWGATYRITDSVGVGARVVKMVKGGDKDTGGANGGEKDLEHDPMAELELVPNDLRVIHGGLMKREAEDDASSGGQGKAKKDDEPGVGFRNNNEGGGGGTDGILAGRGGRIGEFGGRVHGFHGRCGRSAVCFFGVGKWFHSILKERVGVNGSHGVLEFCAWR